MIGERERGGGENTRNGRINVLWFCYIYLGCNLVCQFCVSLHSIGGGTNITGGDK